VSKRTISVAVAAISAGIAGLTLVATGMSAVQSPSAVKPVKITVTMSDFKFKFSKPTAPKGVPIVFTVINKGPSPHDWDLDGTKGTPVVDVGKTTVLKVTIKKAGSYRYVCTVPRHAQFGMSGNLTVK
jgi:plastocyanin